MPDAESLRELEQVCPGAAGRWMSLAESEIKSRQKNEDRITWTFKYSTIMGQILGFISSLAIFYVGYFAIDRGSATAGAAIITGSAASVIAAFYFRSRQK